MHRFHSKLLLLFHPTASFVNYFHLTLPLLSVCSLPQVQLCETRRELQELKTSLRVTQKEKEQLLAEKQVRQTGVFTA